MPFARGKTGCEQNSRDARGSLPPCPPEAYSIKSTSKMIYSYLNSMVTPHVSGVAEGGLCDEVGGLATVEEVYHGP